MYFDEKPKDKLQDFYNRKAELKGFLGALKAGRSLVLLLGLRRSGKTSLLRTGLGLAKLPCVIIDARELAQFQRASYRDLLSILESAFQKLLRKRGLVDYLKRIKGVRIHGFELRFEWGKENRLNIGELLEAADAWAEKRGTRIIVGFDEAQLLGRAAGVNFPMLLAHAYDYLGNTTFVLTGSEVGLLYDFLGVDDPEAPLYGRHREEIKLERFDEEKSKDFLLKGFEQAGVMAPADVVEHAVGTLDGIVGWLTEFGARAIERGPRRKVVGEVLGEGSKLAMQELEHFFNVRAIARRRYTAILKRLAQGASSWSELKGFVEHEEKKPIYNKNFTELLNNLLKAGFVERREGLYTISDPVLLHALKKGKSG